MNKTLKNWLAMVRCGENPRSASFSIRTSKAGFLFIPKINVMIKRVETENGECWAIVLHPTASLEDVRDMQNGLINLMIDATDSNLFSNAQEEYHSTLSILRDMLPTPEQASNYERYLKKR